MARQQALVYAQRWNGFLNGAGGFSLLEPDEANGWVEVARIIAWIS